MNLVTRIAAILVVGATGQGLPSDAGSEVEKAIKPWGILPSVTLRIMASGPVIRNSNLDNEGFISALDTLINWPSDRSREKRGLSREMRGWRIWNFRISRLFLCPNKHTPNDFAVASRYSSEILDLYAKSHAVRLPGRMVHSKWNAFSIADVNRSCPINPKVRPVGRIKGIPSDLIAFHSGFQLTCSDGRVDCHYDHANDLHSMLCKPLLAFLVSVIGCFIFTYGWVRFRLADSIYFLWNLVIAMSGIAHICSGTWLFFESDCDRIMNQPLNVSQFLDCLPEEIQRGIIHSTLSPCTPVHSDSRPVVNVPSMPSPSPPSPISEPSGAAA
jgi:hypothetical protein